MASNKERIEVLEAGLGGLQEGMQRIELAVADKLHQLEDTINKISEALLSSEASPSHHNHEREGFSRTYKEDTNNGKNQEDSDGGRQVFSSKMAKLEFPKYAGDDPTEWVDQVAQFFEYQGTPDNQKVSFASFHLEGEAN